MGKSKDLSEAEVNQVKALQCSRKLSIRQIAANISGSSRKDKCGRKRLTTMSMDQLMVRAIRQEPLLSPFQVKNRVQATMSTRPVHRRLKEMSCRSIKPRKVPKLTPAMMKKRLNFSLAHSNWTLADWKRVIFSDESTFQYQAAIKKRVWQVPKSAIPTRQFFKHPQKAI